MAGIIIRSLSDQMVEVIRDRILTGDVAADQPIRQDALAAELGVSKIPLREALTRLEQDGLVVLHPNRGYAVRGLDAAEAEEVYALRLKLEPEIAAIAAQRADDDQRAAVTATFDALAAHTGGVAEDRLAVLVKLNRAFHMAIVRPSALPLTVQMLERLHVLSDRYVHKHLEPSGRDTHAAGEHAALLERWLARDSSGVAAALEQHVLGTLIDLRRQLATDGAAPTSP